MEEQKTEFIVRKKNKTENFSIIYNACLKDNSISWQAKGLFGYLMTLPDNWEIYKTELQKHSSNGRDATIKAFDELIEKGYITVEETKGENGKFGRKIYKVFEVSQGETKIIRKKRNTNKDETPLLNNRSWDTVTGNPLTVNQELLNTNKQITKELNTNTNTSTSLKSEPPKFNPTKKVEKKKRVTAEEKHKQYLSSLPSEINSSAEKCADKLISYLIKLQNSQTAAAHKLAWQEDFARFIVSENKSESEIISIIDFAMTGWWSNKIFSADGLIKQYGKLYQQSQSKMPLQDKRQSARNGGINYDDELKYYHVI